MQTHQNFANSSCALINDSIRKLKLLLSSEGSYYSVGHRSEKANTIPH